jgi:hypothetical protein
VSPALTPIASVLERAADLIEKGMPPGKALRQVVRELEDYERAMAGRHVPEKKFTASLGVPMQRGG